MRSRHVDGSTQPCFVAKMAHSDLPWHYCTSLCHPAGQYCRINVLGLSDMQFATEAAITILRIDDMIKIEKGPEDEEMD